MSDTVVVVHPLDDGDVTAQPLGWYAHDAAVTATVGVSCAVEVRAVRPLAVTATVDVSCALEVRRVVRPRPGGGGVPLARVLPEPRVPRRDRVALHVAAHPVASVKVMVFPLGRWAEEELLDLV